jgi:hypothetical protein
MRDTEFEFACRDFGGRDAEGFQLRVRPELIVLPDDLKYPREELFLDPSVEKAVSSSSHLWPLALPLDLYDSFVEWEVGLITRDRLQEALTFCRLDDTAVVFTRLVGRMAIANGRIDTTVPAGFVAYGYDVTNTWDGLSVISFQPFEPHEWQRLRGIAAGFVNEWNLVTRADIAAEIASICDEYVPEHAPFRPVFYALCPAVEYLRRAQG